MVHELVWMYTHTAHMHVHTCTHMRTHMNNTKTNIRRCFILQTERDVSVRQRAIDLLYAMCDRTNATTIVGELLNYLEKADYSIREELVCTYCSNHIASHIHNKVHMITCIYPDSHMSDCVYGYIICI